MGILQIDFQTPPRPPGQPLLHIPATIPDAPLQPIVNEADNLDNLLQLLQPVRVTVVHTHESPECTSTQTTYMNSEPSVCTNVDTTLTPIHPAKRTKGMHQVQASQELCGSPHPPPQHPQSPTTCHGTS